MCSALISRCIAVVHGDEVMTVQKMQGILITPFAANRNAWNYPPSDFKFAAAEIARTHLGGGNAFNEHWRGIVRAQNPFKIIGAEDRFWIANAANNVCLKQVLFRQFNRMDVTVGSFVNVEGLSSHDYNNGHKDNENTDNKNLNKEPRDDPEEGNAADENIDNHHGSHKDPHLPIHHHSLLSQKCLDLEGHPMNLLLVLTTMGFPLLDCKQQIKRFLLLLGSCRSSFNDTVRWLCRKLYQQSPACLELYPSLLGWHIQ